MNEQPDSIIVVGAGVAGARSAMHFAEAGYKVRMFDFRSPWEKPCGGGLTPKVIREFPDLMDVAGKARRNNRVHFMFPGGRRSALTLSEPILTVSRTLLGESLLHKAEQAGAELVREKVLEVQKREGRWVVSTDKEEYDCALLVGADGVNGVVRRAVAEKIPREDLCMTYGSLLPVEVGMPVVIKFFKGFMGYAWIFPRHGETSVGIALEGGEGKRDDLKGLLEEFVADEFELADLGTPPPGKSFGWLLPALSRESFEKAKVCGPDWALIGDASGSADPVTGEGIYYALKTAGLLARAVDSGNIFNYAVAWRQMANITIAKVSKVSQLFYRSSTLRAIGFMLDYSPEARKLTRELIAGYQSYDSLRARVYADWSKYVRDLLSNSIGSGGGERKRKKKHKRGRR